MAAGGVNDIYISNEVVAPGKLARVAELAYQLAAERGQLAIAVDGIEGVRRLANAMNDRRRTGEAAIIDVFVEIDVGQGRCGVRPGRLAAELALEIRRHPALRFAGLQAYHGKAQHLRSAQARRDAVATVVQDVQFTRKMIEGEGLGVPLVTGAGTGSFANEAASGVFGELQAGSFLFMDADYAANERDPAQPQFEHALFVKAQVMSSGLLHAVCDAGHKSHAIDSGLPRVLVREPTGELEYLNGGDEHGILKPTGGNQRVPRLDETVWLIPGHCDPTVNLHNLMIGVTGGLEQGRVDKVIRVDARGALT
jgi:D-serine deaminase-like pyridoxal phosphate-dependent protein